jgi:hypothetical protein
MDAMKDALKKKMMESKAGQGALEESPEVKSGEVAPPLEGAMEPEEGGEMVLEGGPEGADPALIDAATQAVGPETFNQILMAIADSGSGSGRPSSSLGERAALGARAKLDSMKK